MFPSRRKQFSKIACPGGSQCNLPFCIFSHQTDPEESSPSKENITISASKKLHRVSPNREEEEEEEPPEKRIKNDFEIPAQKSLENSAKLKTIQEPDKITVTQAIDTSSTTCTPTAVTRPNFSFTPRPLTGYSPATPQQRLVYLKALAKSLAGTKKQPDSTEYRQFQIKAVECEYKVALDSSRQTYPANIRHKIIQASRESSQKDKK